MSYNNCPTGGFLLKKQLQIPTSNKQVEACKVIKALNKTISKERPVITNASVKSVSNKTNLIKA